jgi:hemolysin activation/secretion protein
MRGPCAQSSPPQIRRPVALAAASLVVVALALAASRVHAAGEQAVTLAPTQDPCGSCDRPVAQAPAAPQSLPAPPASAPVASFRLNDLRLNGAQTLGSEELQAITRPYIGREVTLADLEALAQAITARYRERGYFLAQAVVPVQTVQGGIVEISVIEGRLGKVDVAVAPDAPIGEQRVRAFLAPLQSGEALSGDRYERAMLLLSDQPGVRVSSALQEGSQPGTTDLTVEVTAGPRWAFTAEADNHGTEESGRYRVGGTARWLSPAGIGDNLDLRAMVSDDGLWFGRAAYEAPIGASGLRAGIGLARVRYELGGQFADLDARGRADVFDVSLSYPVIRQRRQNLFLRLSADTKKLEDELGAVNLSADKRIHGLGLGWAWERRDQVLGGGYWASSGTLYHGKLDIRDPLTLAFDQGVGGHRTEGSFTKLSFLISRLQSVIPRHSLFLSLGGQWASKNLDPSEKLALGGARAVRAYPSGELLADQGWIGTVEWRWSYNEALTPFVFYDAARGKLAHDPTPFDGVNRLSLRGYGVGLSWSRPGNFAINATLAWRDGTRPAQTDGGGRNPRLYVQAQKAF